MKLVTKKDRREAKSEFTVTYFLWKSRKGKDGSAPVYIRSAQNNNGKHILYNTGERIPPQQWSIKKNEPKNKPAKLLELETRLKQTYKDLWDEGLEPTLADLVEAKKGRRNRVPAGSTIVAWADDYLESRKYSEGLKKMVRTAKGDILNFNKNMTFERFKKPQIDRFMETLTERGVANNSAYKRFRAIVNVAKHANVLTPDLASYKVEGSTTNAIKVRLTWPEVKKVIETEALTQIEQTAKDVFLLACFGGLRIADILTLHKGELHEYFYERLQSKTKMPVLVTVHKYNEHLFKKYIDKGVNYSRQRLSDALKDVLERSGLTKEVAHIQKVGYHFKETVTPKFKQIAFHSGRRFYARLLSDLGLSEEIVRDELGHSFKNVTELYSGSQEHIHRVSRVRKAMDGLEKTMKQLALMKVA